MLACEMCGQPTTRKEDPRLCAECYFGYWAKNRMRKLRDAQTPHQQRITKLDCERCKLRTEHYVQFAGDVVLLCRCLRCGLTEGDLQSGSESNELYPEDESRPAYVV